MKKISASLFLAIILMFSAFLAVLSLFSSIKLASLGDEAVRLTREAETLRVENELLATKVEAAASLEYLERYAIDVLGMQHCTPDQIVYIDEAVD